MASSTVVANLINREVENSDAWSLGCDITIEEMDVVVEEIKLNDIAIAGVIKTDDISVDIDHDKNNVMDLDVNVVIDGLNSSIVESQVVPYERVVKINDLSPESSYEKGFAASAKSVKKVKDSVDSLDNSIKTNASNISKVTTDIESLTRRVDRLSEEAGGEDLGGIWYIDESTGNLVTDKQVEIKNNLIVQGDTASGAVGEDPGIIGGFLGVKVGEDEYKYVTPDGLLDMTDAFKDLDVDLSDYYTQKEIDDKITNLNLSQYALDSDLDALEKRVNEADGKVGEIEDSLDNYLLKKAESQTIEGDITIKGNLVVEGDTASTGEGEDTSIDAVTEEQLNEALENYYTKEQVDRAIADIDVSTQLGDYAKKAEVEAVSTRVSTLEKAEYATKVYVNDEIDKIKNNYVSQNTYNIFEQSVEQRIRDLQDFEDTATQDIEKVQRDVETLDDKVTSNADAIAGKADKTELGDYVHLNKASQTITGDVTIDGDLVVKGESASEGIGDYDSNSKGYYATLAELNENYPIASAGSIAYIGTQSPYSIYKWDANNAKWIDSGTKKQDSTPLGNYYTKSETHQAIRDEYIVISQTEYDALVTKEDKLYFCYEE